MFLFPECASKGWFARAVAFSNSPASGNGITRIVGIGNGGPFVCSTHNSARFTKRNLASKRHATLAGLGIVFHEVSCRCTDVKHVYFAVIVDVMVWIPTCV